MKGEINWHFSILAFILMLASYFAPLGLEAQQQAVLSVAVFVAILWITDALPLFVSGIVGAFLLITLGGLEPKMVFTPFFDPIIALLLGGFVLAKGLEKHGLSTWMAYGFLNKIGSSPKKVIFGLMLVTAFLSMWMSNTATTAIMIPIALVILKNNNLAPLKSNFGKATVLGIAYAANIGGIGTIVGTPPNAIAVKFLADHGVYLNFLDWMLLAIPVVIILLPIAWFSLTRMYKSELKKIKVEKVKTALHGKQKNVLGIFALTAVLWLTTPLHGVSSSTIALVPIILLYFLSLLESKDIKTIDWPTLLLVGAGLTLGSAISFTQLDLIGANFLQSMVMEQPLFLILLAIALFSIFLTAFASNTGTASIVVPIMIPLAIFLHIDMRLLVVVAAMATSLDFLLPVGTPPNAIAYSSGYIKVKDMVKAGFLIAILASVIVSVLALFW